MGDAMKPQGAFKDDVYFLYSFGLADRLIEQVDLFKWRVFDLLEAQAGVTRDQRFVLLRRHSRLREQAGRMLKPGHFSFEDLDKAQEWILTLPLVDVAVTDLGL